MVYFKNQEEYILLDIYNLDTDETVLNRLAARLNTLYRYLYFPAGVPTIEGMLKSNSEEESIVVMNILYMIKSAPNFADLYEELPQIDKLTIDDIVTLYVSYNEQILQFSVEKQMFDSILLAEQQNIKEITGKVFNLSNIFLTRDSVVNGINTRIEKESLKAQSIEKIYYQLDQVKGISHTKFVLEKINFTVTLRVDNISLMEVFNNIRLDHNVPFATKNEYYKILKDFVPPVEWSEYKTEEDIILKVNQNKNINEDSFYINSVVSTEKRMKLLENEYTTVLVSANKDTIVLEFEDFIIEKDNVTKEEIIQRVLKILNTSDDIIQNKDTLVNGVFYFPNHKLNKYVFSDLIMNSYLYSSMMSVDESFKATKTSSSFYIHFENKKIGKITANVNEKIMDKKYLKQEIINKDIDPSLFFMNQEFIRVKITKADDIQDVEEFQKLFSKLLTLYDKKFLEVYNYYSQYTNISEPERVVEEAKKVKSLKDIVPELFLPKYTRICRKPPTIIENEEENPNNLQVMTFPKSDKEGTQQRKYICNYDKSIYPGVRENPHSNSDKFPFVPCCYDKPQTKNAKFLQYFENIEPEMPVKKEEKINVYTTNRFATNDDFGYLPKDAAKVFYIGDKDGVYYRKGVYRNKNSFLNCVLEALNINEILKIDDEEQRNAILASTRNELATPSMAAACRQELYDYSVEEILEKIKNPEVYLDPSLFINLLQTKYECNIFIFRRKLNRTELIVPRHLKHYYKYKNSDRCVFIYEHEGTEADNAEYPQCELIVKYNEEINDEYDFDYNAPISQTVIGMFDELRDSYSLNKKIDDTFIDFKDLKVATQFIDSYGKARILNIIFNGVQISLVTDPIQPLSTTEINSLSVNKVDVEIALQAAAYLEIVIYKQVTYGLVCKQLVGKFGNITVTIPINDSKIINGVPEFENTLNYIDSDFSVLDNYNFYKKMSRYVVEYTYWLFSKYLHEKEIYNLEYSEDKPFGDIDIDDFISRNITIQPEFEYKNISKKFSLDSNIMSGGKLVIKNENTLKKVLYYLKMEVIRNNRELLECHNRKTIKNFYLDMSDLDLNNFQVILKGENSVTKWIDDTTYKKDIIRDDIMMDTAEPYFFQNKLISDNILLAQNSNSIKDAIYVSIKWYRDKYNPKKEFNDVKDIPDFFMYTYKNKYEIKKYYIDNKLKNDFGIQILGYKINDRTVFTSLLRTV
jgi:hypothetical protein